jgi:hypothetical protein
MVLNMVMGPIVLRKKRWMAFGKMVKLLCKSSSDIFLIVCS